MNKEEIVKELDDIIDQFGPWTAHNLDLGHGVTTMGKGPKQVWRINFLARLIRQFTACKSENAQDALLVSGVRLLDLACLEGLLAISFAQMGATTVGVDIRKKHLVKAEFARKALALENCTFIQGDVRNLPFKDREFDIILCCGILYHLDFPDCVKFLEDIATITRDLLIIDSYFAYEDIGQCFVPMSAMKAFSFENHSYKGREIVEHAPLLDADSKREVNVWASIDNNISVCLMEKDVVDILHKRDFKLVWQGVVNSKFAELYPGRQTLAFSRI